MRDRKKSCPSPGYRCGLRSGVAGAGGGVVDEKRKGLLFPSPGDLPDPGIKCKSPAVQADSLPFEL